MTTRTFRSKPRHITAIVYSGKRGDGAAIRRFTSLRFTWRQGVGYLGHGDNSIPLQPGDFIVFDGTEYMRVSPETMQILYEEVQ